MKRFVSIFLALCIAAASMTACTKSPASESQPSSQAASTAQSASEPAVQEEEPYNAALLAWKRTLIIPKAAALPL